jgi:hypothetical protein
LKEELLGGIRVVAAMHDGKSGLEAQKENDNNDGMFTKY